MVEKLLGEDFSGVVGTEASSFDLSCGSLLGGLVRYFSSVACSIIYTWLTGTCTLTLERK